MFNLTLFILVTDPLWVCDLMKCVKKHIDSRYAYSHMHQDSSMVVTAMKGLTTTILLLVAKIIYTYK